MSTSRYVLLGEVDAQKIRLLLRRFKERTKEKEELGLEVGRRGERLLLKIAEWFVGTWVVGRVEGCGQ